MTTGQRLNAISRLIDQIQGAINQEHHKLLAAGTTPQVSSMGYAEFWRRLERFGHQLEQALKQLKSTAHLLDLRRQATWNLPRGDLRYQARQSVSDHERHLREVYAKATKAEGDLRKLYFRGQSPTNADLLRGINKLFKEAEGFASRLETEALLQQVDQNAPSFSAPPGGVAPPLSSVTLILTLIVLYLRKGPKGGDKS